MAATTKEAPVTNWEDQRVAVALPLLEDESNGGIVDQTVTVERNGYILRFKRGERVEIPAWAFMIMKQSGKYPTL